jgi:hypothetical protein
VVGGAPYLQQRPMPAVPGNSEPSRRELFVANRVGEGKEMRGNGVGTWMTRWDAWRWERQ